MRNEWVTDKDALVEWRADLSPALHQPDRLLAWLRTVLEAGEEQEVYTVREAPLLHYRRDRDGPLVDFLADHFEQTGLIDLFHFTDSGMLVIEGSRYTTVARLAYYNHAGEVELAEVDDLGALLRGFYPQAELEAPTAVSHRPPLATEGPLINTRNPKESLGVWRRTTVEVRFRLFSDIWFPWVDGVDLDLSADPHKRFDNRELAQHHTPRLNRFFAAVREATEAIGGKWYLDTDRDSLRADRFLVDDAGIKLDVELLVGLTVNDGTPRDPWAELQARKAEWRRWRAEQS